MASSRVKELSSPAAFIPGSSNKSGAAGHPPGVPPLGPGSCATPGPVSGNSEPGCPGQDLDGPVVRPVHRGWEGLALHTASPLGTRSCLRLGPRYNQAKASLRPHHPQQGANVTPWSPAAHLTSARRVAPGDSGLPCNHTVVAQSNRVSTSKVPAFRAGHIPFTGEIII